MYKVFTRRTTILTQIMLQIFSPLLQFYDSHHWTIFLISLHVALLPVLDFQLVEETQ